MFDIIMKILDTLKDGAKFYKDKKKELFTNFIVPAMSDFELVHNNYMETFRTYIELISGSKSFNDIAPQIIETIKNDSLFSDNIREKVYSFCDYVGTEFNDFSDNIISYFMFASKAPNYSSELECNVPRGIYLDSLIDILKENTTDDDKKKHAIDQGRMIVNHLQRRYRIVADSFNYLKNDFLK